MQLLPSSQQGFELVSIDQFLRENKRRRVTIIIHPSKLPSNGDRGEGIASEGSRFNEKSFEKDTKFNLI